MPASFFPFFSPLSLSLSLRLSWNPQSNFQAEFPRRQTGGLASSAIVIKGNAVESESCEVKSNLMDASGIKTIGHGSC